MTGPLGATRCLPLGMLTLAVLLATGARAVPAAWRTETA